MVYFGETASERSSARSSGSPDAGRKWGSYFNRASFLLPSFKFPFTFLPWAVQKTLGQRKNSSRCDQHLDGKRFGLSIFRHRERNGDDVGFQGGNFIELIIQVVADECGQFYEAQNRSCDELRGCLAACFNCTSERLTLCTFWLKYRWLSGVKVKHWNCSIEKTHSTGLMAEVEEAMEDAR